MALNTACADEIEQLCDEEFFAENTMPCLVKYRVSDEDISEKCQSVMQWALPEEAIEPVTDELGMSEEDRLEKEEWRAKRKQGREDAIERMKMKEQDAKKDRRRGGSCKSFRRKAPRSIKQCLLRRRRTSARQPSRRGVKGCSRLHGSASGGLRRARTPMPQMLQARDQRPKARSQRGPGTAP
ncbi:unnamed protein product [Effrenium voratum]|uniref:Uncharacterized protein n=1 Tax=Effrenium voratum TaxID=2562239 RepID=A0AA36HSF5_9DINO|nr:unnamed protein product [Effrenium voratum]